MNSLLSLESWHSPSRNDNWATTDPALASESAVEPDYRRVRREGMVFSPALPQPVGTAALHGWYSPSRGDHFITSDPRWAGSPGDRRLPDYEYLRLEGYAHSQPLAGTAPLQSLYNQDVQDNFATADPRWNGERGERRGNGSYKIYRTEGYLVPPSGIRQPPDLSTRFGCPPLPIEGAKPLLIVLVDFAGVRVRRTEEYYEELFFGPTEPNVNRFFDSISAGRFRFSRAGVVRIRYPADSPEGLSAAESDAKVTELVASAGFDFSQYDTDGDGEVTNDDLAVVKIANTPGARGLGQARPRTTTLPSGLRVSGDTCNCDQDGSLNLFAHELFHALGFREHIYGPGVNARASFFASSSPVDQYPGPVQLDPWHKVRAGWLEPRFIPVTRAGNSTRIQVTGPGLDEWGSPIVLYDPNRLFNPEIRARGLDEFFILEYRAPSGSLSRYDTGVLGQGLAVWYVQKRQSNNTLVNFDWPPPIPTPPPGGGDTEADYIVGSAGPGFGPFWKATDGEFSLSWGDGSDSKLRLTVGATSGESSSVEIEWRHAAQPFLPRIDLVRGGQALRAGEPVVLDGVFGLQGSRSVRLVREGTDIELPIEAWTGASITARVPAGTALGEYELGISADGAGGPFGNTLPVVVAPERFIAGTVKIQNKNSDKLVAVAGGETRQGADVVQWDDNDQEDVKWQLLAVGDGYYKIRNRKSGRFLAVAGSSTATGTDVIQWSDNGQPDLEWRLVPESDGFFKLKNRKSGKVLAVAGGGTRNGADIVQWDDNDQEDVKWRLLSFLGEGTYRLKNKNSGKLAAVAGGATEEGADVIQWEDRDQKDVEWLLLRTAGGSYKIQNRNSDKLLAVSGSSTAAGGDIVQAADVGQDGIEWTLVPTNDGYFKVKNAFSGKFMAVADSATRNGADIIQRVDDNQEDIKWRLMFIG